MSHRYSPSSYDCSSSPARTTGGQFGIPWVSGDSIAYSLSGIIPAEFRAGRRRYHNNTSLLEAGAQACVVVSHNPTSGKACSQRTWDILHESTFIFDHERNPAKRRVHVDPFCQLCPGCIVGSGYNRVERRIDLLNGFYGRVQYLLRRDLLSPNQSSQPGGVQCRIFRYFHNLPITFPDVLRRTRLFNSFPLPRLYLRHINRWFSFAPGRRALQLCRELKHQLILINGAIYLDANR